MPGQTPNYQIPYAVLSDPADAQVATKSMADRLDVLLGQLTQGQTKVYSGMGANAPNVILPNNAAKALVTAAYAVKLGRMVMLNIVYNLLVSIGSDSQGNIAGANTTEIGYLVTEIRPYATTFAFASAGRLPVGVQLDPSGRVAMEFTFDAYQAPIVMGGYHLTACFQSLS